MQLFIWILSLSSCVVTRFSEAKPRGVVRVSSARGTYATIPYGIWQRMLYAFVRVRAAVAHSQRAFQKACAKAGAI